MTVRLLQKKATVHSKPDTASAPVAELRSHDDFFTGEVVQADTKQWVAVTDINGEEGYIQGNTKVRELQGEAVSLAQEGVGVLESLRVGAKVKHTCTMGDIFTIMSVELHSGTKWVRIRTVSGEDGFMSVLRQP